MKNFVAWLSEHTLTAILIVCTAYAIGFVIANRKSLFYKE